MAATQARTARRQKREEARGLAMRAALELAGAQPFRDVTVDEIAKAAGLSRSAFYTHFSDKHELLLAAAGEVAAEFYAESDRWWSGEGAPAERVRRAIEGVVSVYADRAALMRVVTEVSTYDDELREFWMGAMERFIESTAAHIRSEQRKGLIPDILEARATAEGLVWMIERCCYVYLARGERSPESLVTETAPVWVAALYPGVIPAHELRPADLDTLS